MAVKRAVETAIPPAPRSAWSARWPRHRHATTIIALLLGAGMVAGYVLYLRSADVAPDSVYGYGFAIAGTLLLSAVGAGYALRKRLRRNWSGALHTALRWHVAGGALALLLILMHAAGNFHPRTGTYALCSLIALVVSGIVGRLLDSVAPRLTARAALKTLTPDGGERLDALVGALHETRRDGHALPQKRARQDMMNTPWDLAYYDLGARPDEIPTLLNQHKAGSSHHAAVARESGQPAANPATSALAAESVAIRRALAAERLYLQLIRVWRFLHTALSIATLALILWHLEFAATLLLGKR